jgi:disulfide oxidoreductase YuzD
MRGNMVAKIKSSIFSTFGEDSLPSLTNNPTQKEIMDWKKKKEVRKAFKKLHKKINDDGDEETPTWCNKILQKAFPNPAKVEKPLLAFAVGAIEIILDPDNGGVRVKDEIMKSKIRKNIVSFI